MSRFRVGKWPALALIAILAVGCGRAAVVAPTPDPTPTPVVTPDPTRDPTFETGIITFGKGFDPSTLLIVGASSRFKASSTSIAWSASLSSTMNATTVTLIIASHSTSGVERTILKQDIDVSDPSADVFANKLDLAGIVGRKPGTYAMRYLRGGTLLSEGLFTLVK